METTKEQLTDSEILQKVLDTLRYSAHDMSKKLGYASPGTLYHVLNGINNLSDNLAMRLVKEFPQLNYVFLKTGKGKIFNEKDKHVQTQQNLLGSPNAASFDNIPKTLEEIKDLLVIIAEELQNRKE